MISMRLAEGSSKYTPLPTPSLKVVHRALNGKKTPGVGAPQPGINECLAAATHSALTDVAVTAFFYGFHDLLL